MKNPFVAVGFNRAFLVNPVTWVVVALAGLSSIVAGQANHHYDYTCAAIAPAVTSIVSNDDYFVQRLDNVTYENCLGRIPEEFADIWPLTDCSPGGRSRFSDGTLAWFPQRCRFSTGVYQVF